MAALDVVQGILHYKRDIEKICSRPEKALKYEDRLLHCVGKLHKMPVTVNHLQETGIGKTINSLRKMGGKKGLSDAAKRLVDKWKVMVVEEDAEEERRVQQRLQEEDASRIKLIQKVERGEYCPGNTEEDSKIDYKPSTSQSQSNSYSPQSTSQNTDSDNYSPSKKKPKNNSYSPQSLSQHYDSDASYAPSKKKPKNNSYTPQSLTQNNDYKANYSPSKKKPKHNGYSPGSPSANGIEVFCYSPSKKTEQSSKEKLNYKESDSGGGASGSESDQKKSSKSSQHRSSKHKSESTSSKSSRDKGESSSSRHKSESSSSGKSSSKEKSSGREERSSSSSKTVGKKAVDEDGIDFQSGASFADALCPKIQKKSSSKKKSHSDKVESSSSSSKHKTENSSSSSTHKKEISSSNSNHKSTNGTSSTSKSSYRDSASSSTKHRISHESSKPSTSYKPVEELLDDVAGPSHLAPLNVDLVSTLAVPTPNYRPVPHPPLTAAEKRIRNQEEEDALALIMSNKNSRTKVYSGVRGGLNYVPSLYEFCCNILKQHIDSLEYTGGIPYSLLKPVLDGATPSQLYQFEHYNAYIIGDTDHLWQFHCNKEFRGEARQEMETWRDMYLRCLDEREERYKNVTANIQQAIKKSVPLRQTKLAYVDIAKPPRNILKKQIKNGTSKPDLARLMGRTNPDAVPVRPPPKSSAPTTPSIFRIKPKVAPLMQKTLKSLKQTRFKR